MYTPRLWYPDLKTSTSHIGLFLGGGGDTKEYVKVLKKYTLVLAVFV